MNMEYVWTEDDLRLMGVHFVGKDTCVLSIHGMGGNIIENKFGVMLGEELSANGYGYIFAHNRGHSRINDIAKKPTNQDNGFNYQTIGSTYELFTDSPKDITPWLEKCRELGYKKIILFGHSLGCNKIVYYLSQNDPDDVVGVILASPPDLVGMVETNNYQPDHTKLLQEAEDLVSLGKPDDLVSGRLWDWEDKSAANYLSLFSGNNEADNLPVHHNPDKWQQLALVSKQILAIMGEFDDIKIRDLHENMELIKSKAVSCPDYQIEFIAGANHNYENREAELSQTIIKWLESRKV
jgi:pimeloyl-ACP methyl ester carboxylesterase